MIECLILGDSIAVGVSNRRPDCIVEARVGINSISFARRFKGSDAETTVISLGSNDHGFDSEPHLRSVRAKINANRVLWILSFNRPAAAEAALRVAAEFGDTVALMKPGLMAGDRVHPNSNGYNDLAERF